MSENKRILVVDDEIKIVEFLSFILEKNGYEVHSATDGLQATTVALQKKPDLIILDIMMPAGSGIMVYNRLKQSILTKSIPVIFVTAMPVDTARSKLPPGDTSLIFSKLFNPEDLLTAIKQQVEVH